MPTLYLLTGWGGERFSTRANDRGGSARVTEVRADRRMSRQPGERNLLEERPNLCDTHLRVTDATSGQDAIRSSK